MIGKVWKRPSSKIYENLTADNVNFILTKLQFFSFIVSLLEPFLLKYQSDKTMLPLLLDGLLELVKKVLIIKPNLAHVCSTVTELKKIKLTIKDNFLKLRRSTLGPVQGIVLLIWKNLIWFQPKTMLHSEMVL